MASNKKESKKDLINWLYQLIMAAPIAIMVMLLAAGLGWIFFDFWKGIIWGVFLIVWLLICLRYIPNKPPHVGLVIIWGKRIPVVKNEGWHLFAPFFPFMYGVIRIRVEKTHLNFVFEDIRCRSLKKTIKEKNEDNPQAGGEVSINISLIYFPDYHNGRRLISFVDAGEHDQIKKMIEKILEEDLRQMACDNTWEEITFSTEEIKQKLVLKLTGERLTEEVAEELSKNGLPDIADLGVKITRFNVGKIKEQGDLAEAAGRFAKEQLERRAETEELEVVREMLKKYKRLGVSPEEALDAIQTERKKAEKKIFAVRGIEGIGKSAVAGLGMVGEVLEKQKKEKKSKRAK